MRQKFVQTDKVLKALIECPWSRWIVRVVGGFQCFESYNDFQTFKNAADEADPSFFVWSPIAILQLLMCGGEVNCFECVNETFCYKIKS